MILLDTHVWFWWVQDVPRLTVEHQALLSGNEASGLAISAISCWEIAVLVAKGRLVLPIDVKDWMEQALAYPGLQLLPLTPVIAIESTRLPGTFHSDPADRIIVATSRLLAIPLLTADAKIRAYDSVKLA